MRVVAENISVKRGEDLILAEVSFDLSPTESLTVSGPNGVGKSTLLRALAGLLPLDKGSFEIQTDDIEQRPPHEHCHYIGHQNAMKSELSVLENLSFWQRSMYQDHSGSQNQSGSQDQAGDSSFVVSPEIAADKLGLSHTLDLPFGFLSQGQRRRIALAKLLISYRPVWLLDEPTAALDKASNAKFAEMTNEYLTQGGIVIAATHVPLGFNNSKKLEMTPPPLNEDYF